jgi:hypothetical protein
MLKAELFHAGKHNKANSGFPQTAMRAPLKTALNGVHVQIHCPITFLWYPSDRRLTGPRGDLDMVIKKKLSCSGLK